MSYPSCLHEKYVWDVLCALGFDKTNSKNKSLPLDKNGNIIVRLSDEDLNKISSNLVDDDYIIKRVLYCLDGATISDGTFSTYCDR